MKRLRALPLILLAFCFFTQNSDAQDDKSAEDAPSYRVEDGWIIGRNLPRYNNRPVYLRESRAFVLTGDRPIARMAMDSRLYGTICFTFQRQDKKTPLDKFSEIKSCYQAGKMKWELEDSSVPDLRVSLFLLPSGSDGFVVNLCVSGMNEGDFVEWNYGGPKDVNGNADWTYDALGLSEILTWGVDDDFTPLRQGRFEKDGTYVLTAKMNPQGELTVATGDENDLAEAVEADRQFQDRLGIQTPCPELDAMARASLNAVDRTWRAPVFVHGGMQWNNPFPGWRTVFGGVMYGWHDRVLEEAKYYIDSQVKTSDKVSFDSDPDYLYTKAAPNSRFYGVGRIERDQAFYDMQTQFFDQLIEEYRWTNDPQLTAILRDALELHIRWMTECFDPDGDGLFESYINVWPTDSVWYNGGGTAEETSYAYRAHAAALDMAAAASDEAGVERHRREMEKIKSAFQNILWIKDKGYPGSYVEQGGYRRVHQNPWLYSIFLPIDAGLTDELQTLEALYYPEWALQNDAIGDDGRMIWTSNWVPGTWSARERWPGDNYHLAQMCFQSGLSDQGWELMKGAFTHTGFYREVPGNLGDRQGGTDFGDCVHPFARCLVEGLFGYRPNYPKQEALIAPSFPRVWKNARLELPDYQIDYRNDGQKLTCLVGLARPTNIKLRLPVFAKKIRRVLAGGKEVDYQTLPYPGGTLVCVDAGVNCTADVEIDYEEDDPTEAVVYLKAEAGEELTLSFPDASVERVEDPEGVASQISVDGGAAQIKFADCFGRRSLFAVANKGGLPQLRIFRVQFKEDDSLSTQESLSQDEIKACDWTPVDIRQVMNADVRTIFQQKYLEPRPRTISVRIGVDGFSPWTFPYWGSGPPEICLDAVETMKDGDVLTTPQGARFMMMEESQNIAFVSLWNNYPDEITIPTRGARGDAVAFLICGSTNIMQCHIDNAVLEICYGDGVKDEIRLVPPVNYWNLCPIDGHATAPGQNSRAYYTSETDRFCLPAELPQTATLGRNCVAMLLTARLRENQPVEQVVLRCMSQEVVVGLMGISIGEKKR
ncbi:MAG: hypothetical protein IK077_06270 [Thermoguttaceae bacterium]|nr:hypothetical protein [Thermoguttaceae bacterium]